MPLDEKLASVPRGMGIRPGLGRTVRVTFAEVTGSGGIAAEMSTLPLGPLPHADYVGYVFDLSTTAEFTGPVTVELEFGSAEAPHALRLFRFHPATGWGDITESFDLAQHTIRGVSDCLGAFAIGQPRTWFLRGDANNDEDVDLSDAIYSLNHLFVGGPPFRCQEAADSNGDGAVDVSDASYILDHLFRGGAAPPSPYPECGSGTVEGSCLDSACAVDPASRHDLEQTTRFFTAWRPGDRVGRRPCSRRRWRSRARRCWPNSPYTFTKEEESCRSSGDSWPRSNSSKIHSTEKVMNGTSTITVCTKTTSVNRQIVLVLMTGLCCTEEFRGGKHYRLSRVQALQ